MFHHQCCTFSSVFCNLFQKRIDLFVGARPEKSAAVKISTSQTDEAQSFTRKVNAGIIMCMISFAETWDFSSCSQITILEQFIKLRLINIDGNRTDCFAIPIFIILPIMFAKIISTFGKYTLTC